MSYFTHANRWLTSAFALFLFVFLAALTLLTQSSPTATASDGRVLTDAQMTALFGDATGPGGGGPQCVGSLDCTSGRVLTVGGNATCYRCGDPENDAGTTNKVCCDTPLAKTCSPNGDPNNPTYPCSDLEWYSTTPINPDDPPPTIGKTGTCGDAVCSPYRDTMSKCVKLKNFLDASGDPCK